MTASRRSPAVDPEDLRARLAANKIVKVAVAASAHFPEGTVGRVRRVGDPAVDGDEYVFVELTVDGAKDLVPFSPSDLGPAAGRGAKAAAPKAPARPEKPATPPAKPAAPSRPLPKPVVTSTAAPAESRRTPGRARSAGDGDGPSRGAAASTSAATATRDVTPSPSVGGGSGAAPSSSGARPRPSAKGSRKPGPPVTVTLTSTDEPGQWRVDAKVGSRAVVKATAVPAARVWEMVQSLDSEPLAEAVRAHLDEQRRQAAERAERLRAELEAVQAELAALPDSV